MDGIQVGLTVGHDGVGRHADQVLYAGTDVAEPQLRQAAFQTVDGAAGQVVGQGFEAHACVLAFGQVLQRAAERDDAALLVAQGAAHEAGREPPSVRAVVHDIEAVGLAGADAQLHGSGEPGKILRSEHGAQGMARQRRTLGSRPFITYIISEAWKCSVSSSHVQLPRRASCSAWRSTS